VIYDQGMTVPLVAQISNSPKGGHKMGRARNASVKEKIRRVQIRRRSRPKNPRRGSNFGIGRAPRPEGKHPSDLGLAEGRQARIQWEWSKPIKEKEGSGTKIEPDNTSPFTRKEQ